MTGMNKAITDIERAKDQLEGMKKHFAEQAKVCKESKATASEFYYDGLVYGLKIAQEIMGIYAQGWRD